MIKDYYKILGVKSEATGTEIKKAYRDAAIRLHPDKNKAPNAHLDFVELNEAFQILSDTVKREKYDLLYKHFILQNGEELSKGATSGFETIRNEAQSKSEEIASSNFYMFTTEILAEIIGHVLVEGVVSGLGGVLKGTGEMIGEALSNVDIDL